MSTAGNQPGPATRTGTRGAEPAAGDDPQDGLTGCPGPVPAARWFLRVQDKPQPGTPAGYAAPATGPDAVNLEHDPAGRETGWYSPYGQIESPDDWPPRQGRPAGRTRAPVPLRRRRLTAAVPAVIVVAVAALAAAILTGHEIGSGTPGPARAAGRVQPTGAITLPVYPGEQQRGVFRTVSRIVAGGRTVVASGSQASDGVVRQQFIVSADGGRSWRLAPARRPDGRLAPPGYAAPLLAGGPRGWMAEGPDGIWTSRDGRSWTLAAVHGISPEEPGDSVWVATGTAQGFLAAGSGSLGRGSSQAVIWTSGDGLRWHRETAVQAGLASPGETVLNIAYATWRGNATVISGEVMRGGATYDGVWRSGDGGLTWTRVTVPAGQGSENQVSGLAANSAGLIAIRPGRAADGTAEGVAYFSPDGRTWQYAATVGAGSGWTPGVVKGSSYGFVVTGTAGSGEIIAYTSTGSGRTWLAAAPLGAAAAESVTSATVLPDGTAAAVGSAVPGKLSQQPVFLEADPAGNLREVTVPGGIPEVTVRGTAVADGQQIAVGSADGFPAVWRKAPDGPWQLVSSPALVSAYPALRSLSSVTHGPAGWLAVGAPGPVVLTSADGMRWRAAPAGITANLAGVRAVAAAADSSGYVIAGKLVGPDGVDAAGLWWSPDLVRWTRAQDLDLAGGSSQVLAVAAGDRGFVSAGSHDGKPAVWVTSGGTAWKTVLLPLPAGASASVLQQIAVQGSRVAALGQAVTAAGVSPLAEVSADGGNTWRQVPFSTNRPDMKITALAGSPGGFTAAGRTSVDTAAWTSATGTSWGPSRGIGANGPGSWQIAALAPSGTGVVAIIGLATENSQQFMSRRL